MVLPAALPSSVAPPSLQELAERIRPVVLARQAVVPVLEPLERLVPDGGLIRGSTITIGGVGATSLALQLSTILLLLAGPLSDPTREQAGAPLAATGAAGATVLSPSQP